MISPSIKGKSVTAVPDNRLYELGKIFNTKKVVEAVIEFVDIAGLVRGASKGEGLGNQFLSHIREVDAIVHVVRCFDDENVVHVDGSVDPIRDIETINYELIFSDADALERRIAKLVKTAKNDKSLQAELDLSKKLKEHLDEGKSARTLECTDDEFDMIKTFNLLTSKSVLYACNVVEDDLKDEAKDNEYVNKVRQLAENEGNSVFVVCAQVEQEISELDHEDKMMFLEDLGVSESGLDKLIRASYDLLGLISYLTAGEIETRAWTITRGTKAPGAAGKIHSDFERGFIKAEIVGYDDLMSNGSMTAAREKGLVRMEGKEYVVKDGDVINFRFNV